MAEAGEISEVRVHSITRLGRNQLDILATIKELTALEVNVTSKKENLSMLNEDVFSFGGIFINKHSDMIANDNIKHYTKREIQEIYNISLSKIDKEIASKQLGIIKIGKSVRIPRNELFKWLRKYNPTSASV